ncbi:O-antigen ligase [Desulfosporosinus acididurans]|uniref:O-antigen ligase n=1 Tax=Desulfosporosinus acididurans TaxID=476652 RepID=A0A0J1FTW2_9FIRM|nr:O-antigen ligase family protein [Desulfosporosinus acididurans]KLU66904.1 O-antigen ligase [Desulfosporosinus acididurans]
MMLVLQWCFFLLSLAVVVYCGWKKPSALISFLAGAVALDVSIRWFPPLGGIGSQINSLARLFTVGIIVALLWSLGRDPEKRRELKKLFKHPMTIALLIYIAVGAFSIVYTISKADTIMGVVRLITMFLLYLGVYLLAEKSTGLLPLKVVHWMGVALVPLTIYEGATKHFLWRGYLAEGMIARVNATFVDPNIFARYLVLGIVANLLLQYMCQESRKRFLYLGTLIGLLGALAITLSRSGVVTLVAVLILMCLLIPRKGILQPIGVLGIIGVVIAALRPTVWNRILTIRNGLGALDEQRAYLFRVSFAMFHDHPLFGVGLGGFQKSFLTNYPSYKTVIPYVQGVTLSHTTILTIAAELGIVGLTALALVWLAIFRNLWNLRRSRQVEASKSGVSRPEFYKGTDLNNANLEAATENTGKQEAVSRKSGFPRDYLLGVGYFLWIAAIFISSQSEARFFEDPMIWLSMSMMVHLLVGKVGSGNRREFNDTAN